MEIRRLDKVLRALEKLERESKRKNNGNVIVGFNASYALYVHENVEMKWRGLPRKGKHADGTRKKGDYWDPPGRGQSKFLEQPARTMRKELSAIIANAVANGADLTKALLVAGLRLQREAQKLCPVDTGNLKASAFTEKE